MLKTIRKHNKWLMVGFGVLLMVTWLVQPAINQFNSAVQNRVVAKLDGKNITARESSQAYSEVSAVGKLVPGVANVIGLLDPDPVHWMLVTREAQDAGFIGGPRDGEDWNEVVAATAFQLAMSQYGEIAQQIFREIPSLTQQFFDQAGPLVPRRIDMVAGEQHMSREQVHGALAKARGVKRMIDAYRSAARLSDRAAIITAREYLDAAKVNYIFIPAERLIDAIADPDAAALQAHFDLYKPVKPGEGDYGIGYLLPARVKLEWMMLDRAAIEGAISLDPVEVYRRYGQNKGPTGKYPGEFAVEKPRVESDMKGEVVEKVMQEAQIAVQTELLKAAKILEPDGKYKKLPADWESRRPKFEAVAQAVVEAVRKATDVTIPLPTVTTRAADWLTRDELRAIPTIGTSHMRAGPRQVRFDDVVFWTRELSASGTDEGLIPIQAGLPVSESYLSDSLGNRYYMTVLSTKGESAPDSIDEKRGQIVKDFKKIKAFEQLKSQAEEVRSKAVSGGLEAVIAAYPAAEAPKPDPATPDAPAKLPEDPKFKALEITKDVTVNSEILGNADPTVGAADVAKQVLEAAKKIDPLLPREQVPADAATLSIPIPKRLGLAVIRIVNPDPVTIEKFRQYEAAVIQRSQLAELIGPTPKPQDDPFSFANLLKRHRYTSGERDIRTVDDLKKEDGADQGG